MAYTVVGFESVEDALLLINPPFEILNRGEIHLILVKFGERLVVFKRNDHHPADNPGLQILSDIAKELGDKKPVNKEVSQYTLELSFEQLKKMLEGLDVAIRYIP